MKVLNNLSSWFSGLQPRERVIIIVGAVLLFIAAIYMALLPAIQRNAELEQQYKSLSEDMHWLREQGEVVSRLNGNCSSEAIQNGKKREVIARIVRRNQLKLLGLEQDGSSFYSLSVSTSSPNRILQLIYQFSCQGLVLETVDVRSSAGDTVIYAADIEVKDVN